MDLAFFDHFNSEKGVATFQIILIIGTIVVGGGILYEDWDGDNQRTYQEILDKTSNQFDTDTDRTKDEKETASKDNPQSKDTDNDGLNDKKELTLGTDPEKSDTDQDGLSDGKEVLELETDPLKADTDSDGLEDGPEVHKHQTNPLQPDTDSDGLEDGPEVDLPDANPLRMDVFVEVDHLSNAQNLSSSAISELKKRFSNAPVENPNGTQGISLHIDLDDSIGINQNTLVMDHKNGPYNDFDDFKDAYFTESRKGKYHYALLAKFVKFDGESVGGLAHPSKGFIVSTHREDILTLYLDVPLGEDVVGSTFMHELGHSIGLWSYVFEGIDSHKYSYDKYPSVMNYNAKTDKNWYNKLNYLHPLFGSYGYSNGRTFNDWQYLEEHGLEISP